MKLCRCGQEIETDSHLCAGCLNELGELSFHGSKTNFWERAKAAVEFIEALEEIKHEDDTPVDYIAERVAGGDEILQQRLELIGDILLKTDGEIWEQYNLS